MNDAPLTPPLEGAPPPAPAAAPKFSTDVDAFNTAVDPDDIELTMTQLEQERRTLQRQQDALREKQLLEKVDARIPKQQPAMADEIVLNETSKQLEAAHPYVAAMTENQLLWLADVASAEA